MKKYIFVLLVSLLFPVFCFGGTHNIQVTHVQEEASTNESCDPLGASDYVYYDLDWSDGIRDGEKICIDGGTDDVVITGSSSFDLDSTDANSTSGGTYGWEWDTTCNTHLEIPVDDLTTASGRITFTVTLPDTQPANSTVTMFEWGTGANTRIMAQWAFSGYGTSNNYWKLNLVHDSDGYDIYYQPLYSNLTLGAQYTGYVDWSTTTGEVEVSFGDYTNTSSDDRVDGTFTTPATGLRFGEDATNGCGKSFSIGYDDIIVGPSEQ